MTSQYLGVRQLQVLAQIGEVLLPGDSDMPSFASTHCIDWIDDILEETPEQDVKELSMLLTGLSLCPSAAVNWLIKLAENAEKFPGVIGAQLRLLNLGVRGILFSLYYSGLNGCYVEQETSLESICYTIKCDTD